MRILTRAFSMAASSAARRAFMSKKAGAEVEVGASTSTTAGSSEAPGFVFDHVPRSPTPTLQK